MFDRSEIDRLLNQITPGPWAWSKYGDQYEVFTQDPNTEPGDVADNVQILADAEFIAAAPALVQALLAELDDIGDPGKAYKDGYRKGVADLDAANATLARIQAVAADVDSDLARHILNIIGGEA